MNFFDKSEVNENIKKFGKRLKQARASAKLKQVELAYLIGSDVKDVSIWENGRHNRRMSVQKIQQVVDVLNIPYAEQMYWLGLLGYTPTTRMPKAKRILKELEIYAHSIRTDPIPSVIVDYRFNIWAYNAGAIKNIGDKNRAIDVIENNLSNIFTLLLSEASNNIRENKEWTPDLIKNLHSQTIIFKAINLKRSHEPFWNLYPQLFKELLPDHYSVLENVWKLHPIDDVTSINELIISTLGPITVYPRPNERFPIEARQYILPVHTLPQFTILKFHPVVTNSESANYLLDFQSETEQDILNIWDVKSIEDIINLIDNINLDNGFAME